MPESPENKSAELLAVLLDRLEFCNEYASTPSEFQTMVMQWKDAIQLCKDGIIDFPSTWYNAK